MLGFDWKWLVLGTSALFSFPLGADAQYRSPFDNCNTCAAPVRMVNPCVTCARPACDCTCTHAVQQTRLVPQQQISYRDTVETHYRAESVAQTIPVTRTRHIAVDEGGYQMVWVPRIVNRQVSETVLEQRIGTRVVPYQVTRRIPQVSTTLVPEHSIGIVQQHITTGPMVTTAPSLAAPVQLQSPVSYGAVPHMVSPSGYPTLPPIEPYRPGSEEQRLSPPPASLDMPVPRSGATLNDLNTSSTSGTNRRGYVTSPAASVFRQYR